MSEAGTVQRRAPESESDDYEGGRARGGLVSDQENLSRYLERARELSSAEAHEAIIAAALAVLDGLGSGESGFGTPSRGGAAEVDRTRALVSGGSKAHPPPWDDAAYVAWADRKVGSNILMPAAARSFLRAAHATYGLSMAEIVARGIALVLEELEAERGPVVRKLVLMDLDRLDK